MKKSSWILIICCILIYNLQVIWSEKEPDDVVVEVLEQSQGSCSQKSQDGDVIFVHYSIFLFIFGYI